VADWLAGIKMDRYTARFTAAGVLTVDDAAALTPPDLVDLGVTLVGHQRKILGAVQALRVDPRPATTAHLLAAAAGSSDDEQPTAGSSCLV